MVAKLLDETWSINDIAIMIGNRSVDTAIDSDNTRRLTIAACAPEALELLLAIEWNGGGCCGAYTCMQGSRCPVCGVEPTIDKHGDHPSGPHEPGCALDAVLKKARLR